MAAVIVVVIIAALVEGEMVIVSVIAVVQLTPIYTHLHTLPVQELTVCHSEL